MSVYDEDISVVPTNDFEATVNWGASGLVGTLAVRVVRLGQTYVDRTTSGITEYPSGSGVYSVTLHSQPDGFYTVVWDDGSSYVAEQFRFTNVVYAPTVDTSEPGDSFAWQARRHGRKARPRTFRRTGRV